MSAWQRREDAWLAELRDIDQNELWAVPEWATLGYLRTTLQASIAMRACRVELWPAHHYGAGELTIRRLRAELRQS